MQSVSSRIWTRVAVSNSYDDNNYTTGTSIQFDWQMVNQCQFETKEELKQLELRKQPK